VLNLSELLHGSKDFIWDSYSNQILTSLVVLNIVFYTKIAQNNGGFV
jgi:hypothetical protein